MALFPLEEQCLLQQTGFSVCLASKYVPWQNNSTSCAYLLVTYLLTIIVNRLVILAEK